MLYTPMLHLPFQQGEIGCLLTADSLSLFSFILLQKILKHLSLTDVIFILSETYGGIYVCSIFFIIEKRCLEL